MFTDIIPCNFLLNSNLYSGNIGWPKQIKTERGKILIYQLQPESFAGDVLTARAAVSYTRDGEVQSTFGAIWTKSKVSTDRENRTVTLLNLKITDIKFPKRLPTTRSTSLRMLLKMKSPSGNRVFTGRSTYILAG